MKKTQLIQYILAIILTVCIITGCSNSATESHENDENVTTINTFLENEFSGPSEDLQQALEQDGIYPPELQDYVEENYEMLVEDLERFINTNSILEYQRTAYENDYQIRKKNTEILKINETKNNAYSFEVDVEYYRDDQTNTATITGVININNDGKISTIRNMNDDGLAERLRE
ncbi:hypothetical protein M3936_02930 [Sutcliffiella horikoshii]|uniref:hypothetical protein n=1 Tax=Sutcliffiella horikoshii TaxID=79883 RepID=UPI00203AECC4|nr:hypothetical protein [Sutcliffiella horikoshii]MCM3616529.1 hypothetical protein [Sutcliffiella horikoshii]